MSKASGKFVLRLEPSLHRSLRLQAAEQNTSINQLIANQLSSPMRSRLDHQQLVQAIESKWGDSVEGIILFGSSVRGQRRKSSDIDILVVLKKAHPIERSLYQDWDESIGAKFNGPYAPQFSHLPKPDKASSLWLEIALEGEILLDLRGLVGLSVRSLRVEIASGGYTRKMSHGHPYWIRNSVDAQ